MDETDIHPVGHQGGLCLHHLRKKGDHRSLCLPDLRVMTLDGVFSEGLQGLQITAGGEVFEGADAQLRSLQVEQDADRVIELAFDGVPVAAQGVSVVEELAVPPPGLSVGLQGRQPGGVHTGRHPGAGRGGRVLQRLQTVQTGATRGERRVAFSLAGVVSTRMLCLFMILPVFALYAEHLEGVTPALTGLAIGVYGVTQALLQIPAGLLSDRIGRKPVIIGGLLVFALGSAVAAQADSIHLVIVGRALQGSGAIAAAIMALAADLTREEHRIKAMALIGMSIGLSFALAMVLGPVLDRLVQAAGLSSLNANERTKDVLRVLKKVRLADHLFGNKTLEVIRLGAKRDTGHFSKTF